LIPLLMIKDPPAPPPAPPSVGSLSSSTALPPLLVVVGIFSLGLAGDMFILVRAKEVGLADSITPITWAVLHGAKVLSARVAGRRKHAFGGSTVFAWGMVAVGLATLAVASPVTIWLGAILLGIGHGFREPWEKELVRVRTRDDARGAGFGAYHLVVGLSALPAGLGVGALWTKTDGQTALLASASVVFIAALGLLAVVARQKR
jgi:hypothetical protein